MALSLPTADQVKAVSRHMGTAVASILGTLAALKIISGTDVSSLQSSFDQISHGVAETVTGLTALSVAATTLYSALSANPLLQFLKGSKAVAADPSLVQGTNVSDADQATVAKAAIQLPKVESIVAAPEVANAVPSPAVQSTDDVKVVDKAA
jgi:hypothetical protein